MVGNKDMYCQNKIVHTIQAGDSLYKLSRQYHTTVTELILGNPGVNPYNLQIGMQLFICPGEGYVPPQNPGGGNTGGGTGNAGSGTGNTGSGNMSGGTGSMGGNMGGGTGNAGGSNETESEREDSILRLNEDMRLDRVPPVWCITSACENPEGVFKYFIEPMQDGGDVQFLWTYGVEGIHWSTAAETLFAGTENEKTYADGEFHMLENREKEGTQYTKAHIDPMLALVELANDPQEESVAAEAKESAQLFNDNCKAADLVPTTDEMSEYNGDLTTLKNELIAKVVMGELTVDDAYAQFESNHGAEWSQAIVDSLNK